MKIQVGDWVRYRMTWRKDHSTAIGRIDKIHHYDDELLMYEVDGFLLTASIHILEVRPATKNGDIP